ncbi:MAG: rod shape-determining protein RodA [Myxococcota bacterium]
MALVRSFRDQFDWPLFVAATAIAVLGVINLYSASSALGAQSDVYLTQIYWLTLGAVAATFVVAIDYRAYERNAWVIYGGGVVLLVLVFLLGRSIRGSTRWISLGGFSLQPSELMKLFLIVALAKYLHHDPKQDGRTLKDLVVPGLILAVPMGLILLQPDLGTALICAFIFGTIMVLTNLKLRSLATLAAFFVASAPATWFYLLKGYQKGRITAYLDRLQGNEQDILDSGWHTHQSLVAIGSGGLTGKGLLRGTQNQFRFLPDQHSDFPFAVWAEEHGFLGSTLVLGLYLFLVLWGLKIASQAKDRFGAVCSVGVSAMIFWQAMINVGMVSGLLPVVGMTLPLFSYGGSSVLTTMMGIGLLMNISMRRFNY